MAMPEGPDIEEEESDLPDSPEESKADLYHTHDKAFFQNSRYVRANKDFTLSNTNELDTRADYIDGCLANVYFLKGWRKSAYQHAEEAHLWVNLRRGEGGFTARLTNEEKLSISNTNDGNKNQGGQPANVNVTKKV